MSFAFDTLAYARKLRDAKVPQEQAEAMADALTQTFNAPNGVATKADIAVLRSDTARLEAEVMLHRWLFGAMIALQLGTLGAVISLFTFLLRK